MITRLTSLDIERIEPLVAGSMRERFDRLPPKSKHYPWDTPQDVFSAAGAKLGQNYPLPVV